MSEAIAPPRKLALIAAFAARISQYASAERVWIAGTDRMLSASEQTSKDIVATAEAVRAAGPRASTLVVFPEGQVLNYLAEKPNPLRQKLYIPGYLRTSNEPQLLNDLRRTRPDAIVLWPRPTEEYGAAEFGIDYGRDVFAWIERNYALSPIPSSRGRARLYLRSPDVPGALH